MDESLRVATYNAFLNRTEQGALIAELSTPDSEQAQGVAEVVQRVRPDVLLVNEIDTNDGGQSAALFNENYLGVSQGNGLEPIEYPFVYTAPVNTGVPSGVDLDNNGEIGGPGDAFGFGFFPGQFGMALYSQFPIVEDELRTFQTFLWQDMPDAKLPDDPTTLAPEDFYSKEELAAFRLSSKSHWDVPVEVDGEILHVLAAHPTPPVFDGPEDRNGLRNFDEIRFFADYVTPGAGDYIYDDAGDTGGLEPGARFVIVGDYNADPFDGDSTDDAALQFTENPVIDNSITPASIGGIEAALQAAEAGDASVLAQTANPAFDTAEFGLRVDYALPSKLGFDLQDAQVFWPASGAPGAEAVTNSDHRLTYVDVVITEEKAAMDELPNRVASGEVDQDSALLWTRASVAGEVAFEVFGPDGTRVTEGAVTADDPLVPVKLPIEGLAPNTAYSYVATDDAGLSSEGQFTTAAALGEDVGLRFGTAGDWRGELAPFPAVGNVPERELDFFVLHGDTIYADFASPAVDQPQAETLEEFYLKHEEVYGTTGGANFWGEVRQSAPVFATIDDHEVTNDFVGGAEVGEFAELFNSPPEVRVNDSALYENGLTAFQAYNPLEERFYPDTGADPVFDGERELYRFKQYGGDAAVFITDARSFRDAPIANGDVTDPVDVERFFLESGDPTRTLLGEQQVEQLKADLLTAQDNGVTWKFIHVPEPVQLLSPTFAADRFEGYLAERAEILGFIEASGIDNVVFVAADIHGTFVNNLTIPTPDGDIPTGAFEVTTGSVAFEEPAGFVFAEAAAGLGLISPEEFAFFQTLPVAPDADDIPNDKDDFLKAAFNQVFEPLGYDPLGLDENLPVAEGRIDATLLQGDYVAAHTYGWTEFNIDAETQVLTVTTYGIEAYGGDELYPDGFEAGLDETALAEILAREPEIVSQFEVTPQSADAPLPSLLPSLEEAQAIDAAEFVQAPPEAFALPTNGDVVFTLLGNVSAQNAALGFYELNPDGTLGEATIVAPSLDDVATGTAFVGTTEAGRIDGQFIVPYDDPEIGAALAAFTEGGLFFENGATLASATPALFDIEGTPVSVTPLHVLDADITDGVNPLNLGGGVQAIIGAAPDPSGGPVPVGVLAFEDLLADDPLRDNDFNDIVGALSASPLPPVFVDGLIDTLGLPLIDVDGVVL